MAMHFCSLSLARSPYEVLYLHIERTVRFVAHSLPLSLSCLANTDGRGENVDTGSVRVV